MEIRGETTFKAAQEKVWEALLDPEILAQCIPGCKELREIGDDTYEVSLKVGVGAVSGSFEGKLRIDDKVPPTRYSMVFEGSGRQGFAKGAGEAQLRSENGVTVVAYSSEVEIGGLIASVGQRVLEGVSKFMVGQMFTKLRGFVEQEGGP